MRRLRVFANVNGHVGAGLTQALFCNPPKQAAAEPIVMRENSG